MSNTTISPNMNLPVPNVGEDPGPDWATNVDACLNAIDSHNHGAGQGVPIAADGISIQTDLPMNDNNLTDVRSVNFEVQGSPLALGTDIGCIYVSGKDLYYNDEDGNHVRITTGGNVNAGAGSITGLPSGTASVAFSAGTYTFESATSTPATINVGPIVTGAATASPKTVTIAASGSQPANYGLTWPLALPGATSVLSVDSVGQMGAIGVTGTGNIVRDTSPTITTPTIDSATINTSTINTATISGGTIDNVSMTNSALNSTPIGDVAPSHGVFTYAQIGGSCVPFNMKQFSGTLTAGSSVTLFSSGTYTTFFGALGTTSFGSGSNVTMIPGEWIATVATGLCSLSTSTGDIVVHNEDGARSHTYHVTVFYI